MTQAFSHICFYNAATGIHHSFLVNIMVNANLLLTNNAAISPDDLLQPMCTSKAS